MREDLTGRKFGRLTVISYYGIKNKKSHWICKCDCGEEVVCEAYNLKSGNTKRCKKCPTKDLTGKKFGKLTVIGLYGKKHNRFYWNCECECGSGKIVQRRSDVLQDTKHIANCGCVLQEYNENRTQYRKMKLYDVWANMKDRCNNPNNKNYYRYGGRGIKVCEEWNRKDGFLSFLNWALKSGYEEGLTIDRINNDGNYEPSNCRWVDMKQQTRNHSRNRYFTYNGKTQILSDWAKEYNINESTLRVRIFKGKTIEESLKK